MMNKSVLQTSPPVQQLMAGSPNWWNINKMKPSIHPPNHFPQFTLPSSSSSSSSSSSLAVPFWNDDNNNEDQRPESWSHLLWDGLVGDEDKGTMMSHFQANKFENWEEQMVRHHQASSMVVSLFVDMKQENSATSYIYGHENDEDYQIAKLPNWSQTIPPPVSPPKSSVTTGLSSNMLDFSANEGTGRHPPPDRTSDCNSTETGEAVKKARVQPSTTQSTFKVRKEKLGDRITALHQLVSPFGKTDTASVLLEAIGYIRFLQSQVEALSLPYLGSGSSNIRPQQSSGYNEESRKELRSRGLCLVPVSSCSLPVGNNNGADYWASALGGEFPQ